MKPVLIVEDEAIMRDSLRDWLTDGGYQVEIAEDGDEALKSIAEQDFSLLILDLRLPGKDGIKVLQEAREKRPQLKGVIITAYPSVETAVEAMKEGAIDYLPKPFDLNELEKIIRETLGPVQLEIKPRAATEEAKVEEIILVAPEEIPAHLKGREAKKIGVNGYVFIRLEDNVTPQDCLEIRLKLESVREVVYIDDVIGIDWFDTIALVAAPAIVRDVADKMAKIPGIASAQPSRIIAGPEF